MKRWKIMNADGKHVMTVQANTAAAAKHVARREGFRGFCTAEEADAEQKTELPGSAEYAKILAWKRICDGIAADENAADKAAACDILGSISGTHTRAATEYPAFPCSANETEQAKKYAQFLGEVVYRELLRIIPE